MDRATRLRVDGERASAVMRYLTVVVGGRPPPDREGWQSVACLQFALAGTEAGWSGLKYGGMGDPVLDVDGVQLWNLGGAHAGARPCRPRDVSHPERVEIEWIDHFPDGRENPVCLWGYRSYEYAIYAQARLLMAGYQSCVNVAYRRGVIDAIIALGIRGYYGAYGVTDAARYDYYARAAQPWIARYAAAVGATHIPTAATTVTEEKIKAVEAATGITRRKVVV